MNASELAVGQASSRRRAADGAFRAALVGCILVSVAMLALLFYDVIKDGVGRLSFDFLTSFP